MKLEDLESKLGISDLSEEEKLALVKDIQANLPALKAEQMKLESQTQAQMVIAAVKKIQENVENRFNELSGFIENKAAKITSGKDGIQGPKGEKGDKGDRGADGYQGRDGKDGKDGEKGEQGVGVADARVDFDGSLVITLTDGTEIDAGEVLPLDTTEKLKVYFNNPAPTGGGGAVDSVNGQTGEVVLTASDVGAATTAQGALADSAVQPADLATVATTGAYSDLTGTPTIPSALTVKDEGTTLSSAVTSIDFTGDGVTATNTGGAISVAISGGGGGISSADIQEFTSVGSSTWTKPAGAKLVYILAFAGGGGGGSGRRRATASLATACAGGGGGGGGAGHGVNSCPGGKGGDGYIRVVTLF
jgi:hypothetical protein